MSIEEKRRAEFESAVNRDWADEQAMLTRHGGGYLSDLVDKAWWSWNEALDSVVIKMPRATTSMFATSRDARAASEGIDMCANAIESAGLKVKT